MKTWITYLAALLMGLATAMLFGSFPQTEGILSAVSEYFIGFGILIAVPVAFITLASSVASLGRDGRGRKVFGMSLLWAIASTAVLSAAAAIVFIAMPEGFPVTSSAGSAPGTLTSHVAYLMGTSSSSMYPINALWSLATATRFIVPVIILAWILGLAMRPSADIIRPAYTTMNSFSEVMYRISRTYSVYGFIIVYLASSSFFVEVYQEKTLFAAPGFAKLLAISLIAAAIVVLPLLYGIFTGFRKNPYRILYRSIAPAAMGFSTSSIIAALPLNESIARQDLGVQKRIASSVTPLMAVIGKGGSSFVAVITLLSLFRETTGAMPGGNVIAITAAAAAIASFASSASSGMESAIITVLVLRMLGINLYGAENAVIAFIPLLSGIGTLLDSLVASYANSVVAASLETDVEIPYRDTI